MTPTVVQSESVSFMITAVLIRFIEIILRPIKLRSNPTWVIVGLAILIRECFSTIMLLGNFLLAVLFVKLMLEPCSSLNPTWVATGFELAKGGFRGNKSFFLWMLAHPWSIFKKSFTKCKFDKIDIIQYLLYIIRVINCRY